MRSLAGTASPRAGASTGLPALARRCRFLTRAAATFALMTLAAAGMALVAALTLFRLRRLYAEVLARAVGLAILRMWGVRVKVHQAEPFPETQAVYISNHTSTLDLFVLIALGLPNARFFLSGRLRKVVPLGVIGYLIGIFYTVPQSRPADRTRIFQRAERVLRRTRESVYLSPEGTRVTTGQIGPFNKGAFHLATTLRAPIVPMYIRIPREVDPGRGWDARPGTVHVYVRPPIPTRDWTLEHLVRNRETVRDLYLRWHAELGGAR